MSKCPDGFHNYTEVSNSEQREVRDKDTHLLRAFICTKCGDLIIREVSVWKNFIPKSNKTYPKE